jgi:hypothetical protein
VAREDVTTLDTIRDLKNREPFERFRIVMASGDRYLVDDPDALAIGSSQLFLYPRQRSGGVHLRLNQIVAVEENDMPQRTRRRGS